MRLDKYLKVSRLIKRRTVANEVADAGRILINGKTAKASQAVKAGDYETAAAKMKSGDEQYAAGHEQHAKLVQQEAAGDPVTMSLLLTHVEDQMMSTETVKLMVTALIDLYRKLNG